METKTETYPNGSTYKRQILRFCPVSDGTTPCISYRDFDERRGETVELSPALPPANEMQPREPARSKEKRRYLKFGSRMIQVGGSRKKGSEEPKRKRRSIEPKPEVVIVQSASRGQDLVPEAPSAPTARPLYEGTASTLITSSLPRLEDSIIFEEAPVRHRRPTLGVSFVYENPVIIDEAPTRRRRPMLGASIVDNNLPRSTLPQTPASVPGEHQGTEYSHDYPASPLSPPRTPQADYDLSSRRRQQEVDAQPHLYEGPAIASAQSRKPQADLLTADALQARVDLPRAEAREAARLQRKRLHEAQLERDEAEYREKERQADLERTKQQMAKERMSAEARERAERVAEEALDIQKEERRRQEEREEEIPRLGRRVRYYEGKVTVDEEKEQTRRRITDQPLRRSLDTPRYSDRLQPIIIQAPRDPFREEGHRVLEEARRDRDLDVAMKRLELVCKGDDGFEKGRLGRRITISGSHGGRSSSNYRGRARRRREFWFSP